MQGGSQENFINTNHNSHKCNTKTFGVRMKICKAKLLRWKSVILPKLMYFVSFSPWVSIIADFVGHPDDKVQCFKNSVTSNCKTPRWESSVFWKIILPITTGHPADKVVPNFF